LSGCAEFYEQGKRSAVVNHKKKTMLLSAASVISGNTAHRPQLPKVFLYFNRHNLQRSECKFTVKIIAIFDEIVF